MMPKHLLLICVLGTSVFSEAAQLPSPAPRSGIEFASAAVRAMQADDFANPGMLWVTRGEVLWRTPAGSDSRSCASCHQDAQVSMKGVAARYPRINAATSKLINLEGRINHCRERRQHADPLQYETEELLALTTYVAHQSRNVPVSVAADGASRPHFERGRDIYFRRQGQLNLACTNCHTQNVGRKLLADTLSEGHGNAYPIYRLEWQSVGSLQRRLRACYFGVRAEVPVFGSQELVDLELYLARRATGLMVETPGVRR